MKGGSTPPVQVFAISEKAICPARGHDTDAGFDISVVDMKSQGDSLTTPIVLHTHLVVVFNDPTYYGELYARSSLAKKSGFTLSNGVGIIDPSYRGELLVSMFALSRHSKLSLPARVAQLIIKQRTFLDTLRLEQGLWEEHRHRYVTARGEGGFGSTDHTQKSE